MIEQKFVQFQIRQHETVLNITENLLLDKQSLFNKLQLPLSNIECQKKVVQQICSQLLSEEIFDTVVVNKYILAEGDGDFRQLVWEFRNEEQETFLKFLEILKNLQDYPVLCKKFRKAINKVLSENSVSLESNVLSNPLRTVEHAGNQFTNTDYTTLISQSNLDQEHEKFLSLGEATRLKSLVGLKRNNRCTVKQKVILAAFILAVIILFVGLITYLSIWPNSAAISDETSSTISIPTNFTEDQLPEFTTIDSKTVETMVNETLYSYNFL